MSDPSETTQLGMNEGNSIQSYFTAGESMNNHQLRTGPAPPVLSMPSQNMPPGLFIPNGVFVSAPEQHFDSHFNNYATPPLLPFAQHQPPIDTLARQFGHFGMQNHEPSQHHSNTRPHSNANSHHGSESGQGSYPSHRGFRGGRGRGGARQMHFQPRDDLQGFFDAPIAEGPGSEGYGCPPSYMMESIRDETDRQHRAMAGAMLPRGRRAGKQLFPGRRRGHANRANGTANTYNHYGNPHANHHRKDNHVEDDNLELRDRLKKQLEEDNYECMICCQHIQRNQWIWTCTQCFHMFHMNRADTYGCITQWAAKSFDKDLGWRCPSCQHLSFELPQKYRCFCGKRANPPTQRFPDMPHACNSSCGRARAFGCPHPCSEQCHPGPCPPCPSMVTRLCNCGTLSKAIRCGTMPQFQCSKVCGKTLNCGIHKCEEVCHKGDCAVCEEIIVQKCFCGTDERVVSCTALNLQTESYSCGRPCEGIYDCGIHKCDLKCHSKRAEDSCGVCCLAPERKELCPCGRSKITQLIATPRESCTDPIPTCDSVCGKVLPCGNKDKPHRCKQKCHTGACLPCPDNSSIVCRCTALKKTMPCKQFVQYSESNPFTCERRCRKAKSCGNHRCQEVCCVDREHVCLQVCNKKLECGNHNCDRLCHVGQCPRCLQASFEEQYCMCGHTVREPPIACGTALPFCEEPCSREHPCGHSPTHNCHSEEQCPPCTVLTQKPCYGGHEVRFNIPCHLNDVSCGRACDKPLPCGVHTCKRICHPGLCLPPENPLCKQPCSIRRTQDACDHICALPCHGTDPCPKSVCTERVRVTCGCQRKSGEMRCVDVERAYQKAVAVSASESCTDPNTNTKTILKRSPSIDKYRCIPCDTDCHRIQRNRRVANALSISTDSESNPVGLAEKAPIYTDFLKAQLKTSFKQLIDIENALVHLVHAVDMQQNGPTRTHMFRPMSSDLRRAIHEYAAYFRVETVSYDAEPQRNVVATAKRGSSNVPVVLLSMHNNPNANALAPPVTLTSMNSCSSVPSLDKDCSWSSAKGMHQLNSAGKVVKRGVSD